MRLFALLCLCSCEPHPSVRETDYAFDQQVTGDLGRDCWSVLASPGLRCRDRAEYPARTDLRNCAWDEAPLGGKFVIRIEHASNIIAVKCGGF